MAKNLYIYKILKISGVFTVTVIKNVSITQGKYILNNRKNVKYDVQHGNYNLLSQCGKINSFLGTFQYMHLGNSHADIKEIEKMIMEYQEHINDQIEELGKLKAINLKTYHRFKNEINNTWGDKENGIQS